MYFFLVYLQWFQGWDRGKSSGLSSLPTPDAHQPPAAAALHRSRSSARARRRAELNITTMGEISPSVGFELKVRIRAHEL